ILQLLDEVTVAVLEEEADPPPLIEDLLSPHSFDLEPRRRQWLRRPVVGAAGLLLAASLAGIVVAPRVRTPDGNGFGTGEIITGMSESTTIRLGDGTIVRLGPESRLRVVGDRDRREVWMEGRAFFAVARDEARPFHVRTPAGDAVVLGTRFDLEARDDLRVLVVEGAVRLGADGKELDIESSQLGTIAPDHPPTQKELDPDAMAEELS